MRQDADKIRNESEKYNSKIKKTPYNKSLQANWQARFLINRTEPAKAHLGGVTLLPLPIA